MFWKKKVEEKNEGCLKKCPVAMVEEMKKEIIATQAQLCDVIIDLQKTIGKLPSTRSLTLAYEHIGTRSMSGIDVELIKKTVEIERAISARLNEKPRKTLMEIAKGLKLPYSFVTGSSAWKKFKCEKRNNQG